MWVLGAFLLSFLCIWFGTFESAHWSDADILTSVAGYESYLRGHPNGPHAERARARLTGLRLKKEKLEKWLKVIKVQPEDSVLFSAAKKDTSPFKPRFYIINLTPPEKIQLYSFDSTDTIESAQTLVLVKMTSETAGWVYTDGSEAYHWTVRICLVDAENPERQRVMEAQSGSPPKIVDNKWIGGTHILDGVEYDAAKSIQELLVIMLKRAAKQ